MKAIKNEVHVINLELEMTPVEADALRTVLIEYQRFPKAMPERGAPGEDDVGDVGDKVIDAIVKAIGRIF